MRRVDFPPTFHSSTLEVGGSFGSSFWPKHDIGNRVAPPIMAAAIKNLPPMTGVSSITGGVHPLALAFAFGAAFLGLGSAAPAGAGGFSLPDLSLSLMTAG